MTRTIFYHLPSADIENIPLTIKGFLKSKGYSTQNLKILKQFPASILLDGNPIHLNAPLLPGAILTVKIEEMTSSENIVPVNLPLNVIFEDEDLIVINKPAGMPIHPSQNNYDNTLANAVSYYYHQKGEPFTFRCIGRLDRDTSGLTVIAKHYVSAGILGDLVASKALHVRQKEPTASSLLPATSYSLPAANSFLSSASGADAVPNNPWGTWGKASQSFVREYLAIVRGKITPAAGTITAPLGRKPGSVIERCVDYENGEPAVTHYRVLEEKNGYSLISLILETGRTHQIRIHLKHIGHPLIGDYLYNPDYEVISRQALHSHRLSFPHPMTGEPMEFIAPLPEDMRRVLS